MALSNGAQSNGGRISWQDQLQGMPHLVYCVNCQNAGANADPKTIVGERNCNLLCSTLFPIVEVLESFLYFYLRLDLQLCVRMWFCIDHCPLCVSAFVVEHLFTDF